MGYGVQKVRRLGGVQQYQCSNRSELWSFLPNKSPVHAHNILTETCLQILIIIHYEHGTLSCCVHVHLSVILWSYMYNIVLRRVLLSVKIYCIAYSSIK